MEKMCQFGTPSMFLIKKSKNMVLRYLRFVGGKQMRDCFF